MRNYFKLGSWNVHCMVCGKKCKSDAIKKRWDGLLVCSEDYETRHPLDFIRARKERLTVPFAFRATDSTFIDVDYEDCVPTTLTYAGDNSPIYLISGQELAEAPDCECIDQCTTDINSGEDESAIAGYAVAGISIAGKVVSLTP